MYKLNQTLVEPAKFTHTWVMAKGELVEALHYNHVGGGRYELRTHDLVEVKGRAPAKLPGHIVVRDGDMGWAPPLPAGYYNLPTKPWSCAWLAQTSKRQYKVGLNPTTLGCLYTFTPPGKAGIRDRYSKGTNFIIAALACKHGPAPVPVKRGLSMLKKRAAGKMVGISLNLALMKLGHHYVVLYRCNQIVGVVHEGTLHIDNTFNHNDLSNLEYIHGTAKELGEIFRLATSP